MPESGEWQVLILGQGCQCIEGGFWASGAFAEPLRAVQNKSGLLACGRPSNKLDLHRVASDHHPHQNVALGSESPSAGASLFE